MRANGLVLGILIVVAAAGCAPMRRDRNCKWALPVIGAIAGATAGGLGVNAADSDAESGEIAAATAGGAVGGGLVGWLGAYLLCEEEAPPPPVAAPPPPPPPAKGTKIAEILGPNFDFNKATLTPAGVRVVDDASRKLRDSPTIHVMVAGYTDSVGSDAYNQRLSERRAQTVARRLVEDGISESRLDVKGFGEKNPVADNSTEAGRARNRRVELVVE